jgi:hypothetical protein
MLSIPTVHLNGTSREELSRLYQEAYTAIGEAGRALAKAYPNGRDYYPQGADAINKAMREHEARMRKLKEVQDEIEQIAEAIS